MFKTSSSTHAELILLWNDNDIKKSMLYDDFDAVVGGVAPMPQYAKQKKMGAFVQIDDTLTVKGVALFTVNFDRSGYPENGWNVPLSHLVELAGLGPDLGKGPIRLACRSQCPVSWHSTKLWDPVMQGEDSTFAQIQRAIPDACNRLGIRRAKSYTFTETGIPVLTEAALQPSTSTAPLPDLEASALEQKIQDLTLQLNTVLTEKEETINLQSYVHQQQLDILQTQNMKLIDQQKTLKNQYDIQQERLEALNGQIVSLSGIEESLRQERTIHQKQLQELQLSLSAAGEQQQQIAKLLENKDQEYQTRISRLKTEHLLSLDKRLEEEASRYLLSLKSLNAEINEKEETIQELDKEVDSLKHAQAQQQEAGADSFLLKLESIGMNFVAFHAGVGNLSVPVSELVTYIQNPTAYVATKCLVSELHYKLWLHHYENPRCNADIGDGQCCNSRLIRTDSPSRFVAGQSDRCVRHQGADTAIINVLKFN
jgi:hypothetical protein